MYGSGRHKQAHSQCHGALAMTEVIPFVPIKRGTQAGESFGPHDLAVPYWFAETMRTLLLGLMVAFIAGILFFVSVAQKDEKQRQAIEFNEKCLAQGNSGALCGLLYRAEHPIGRGY
jgi:hypothetical protein